MKFLSVVSLLLAGSQSTEMVEALESQALLQSKAREVNMAELVTKALQTGKNTDPKVITIVPTGTKGKHLTTLSTGGVFKDGLYANTTRKTDGQDYLYMWKHTCEWTKWTPSNQYLHGKGQNSINSDFAAGKITLERFGLIGTAQMCFWGMIGVHWKKPLPVWQIKSNNTKSTPEPEYHHQISTATHHITTTHTIHHANGTKTTIVKKTKESTPAPGTHQILLEDDKQMQIGFPGKTEQGQKVLQVVKKEGRPDAVFRIQKITSGVNKGFYSIVLASDSLQALDVLGQAYKDKQYLVTNKFEHKITQIWKLESISAETTISDKAGKWCLTRFEHIPANEGVQVKETQSTLSSLLGMGTKPKIATDIRIAKCIESNNQYWYII